MSNIELTKDVIMKLLAESKDKLSSFGVKSIGLFGSFVKGQQTLDSDIDLLIEFDESKKTYDNFIDTCFYLEEMFKHQVEVVTNDSISPYIKPYIMKDIEYVSLSA